MDTQFGLKSNWT